MEKLRFTELGLSADILKAVDKMGFEEASPIQSAVIPTIMAGRDVVGQSSTGSGKTVAFAIPAIEKVDPKIRAVQVLILCPTRELAVQVAEETGKIALFIFLAMASSLDRMMPERGPRSDLCVVVVVTWAWGTGLGCAPPATSPEICDISASR